MRYLVPLFLLCIFATAETPCVITFSVVSKDDLGNVKQGFSPKTLERYQKKMAAKHPGVCYSAGASPVALWFSTKPDVYHGRTTVSNDGTITDTTSGSSTYGQQVATTTSSQSVPYDVDYDRLYLSIMVKQPDGSWKVVHNFAGKTLHPTYYGLCTHNCHPTYKILEQALDWLSKGGLNDASQSVMP